jgi:hypothetical protein
MNTKYAFIVAAVMVVMLVGATALAVENVYAGKKKENNQATSQATACGNDELPLNVFCQNTESQVEGEDNSVAITGSQSTASEE